MRAHATRAKAVFLPATPLFLDHFDRLGLLDQDLSDRCSIFSSIERTRTADCMPK